MTNDSSPAGVNPPSLKRTLGLFALIIYGLVLIQPTAPMPLFGAAALEGKGHVVTAILIGMVGMLFTAISYGRMANVYPSAGSAYAYVSREIHPAMGYFVGWSIIFDYVLNPIICVLWIGESAKHIIPETPSTAYIVIFAVLFTVMNLRGIEASSRTNTIIATGLGVVIVLFLGAAIRYLWLQPPHGLAAWTRPFYDPQTFSFRTVSSGAALAVLTYIGFDGISTLSEEARNPRRNILLATVLVCVITGVLASIQVYAAQLVWPGTIFPDTDTAISYVAGKAGAGQNFQGIDIASKDAVHSAITAGGGMWLFNAVNLALLVATIGSGAGAHLGAGRLLYSMGRDNAIPRKFFAAVNARTRIPSNNILLLGVVMLIGALTLNWVMGYLRAYALGCEMLNFGALIAFMGVNASAFVHYYVRGARRTVAGFLFPLLGFGVCLYLWLSLRTTAKVAGLVWLSTGFVYGAWRTGGFRKPITFAALDDGTGADSPKAR
jgi:amino acid transporter